MVEVHQCTGDSSTNGFHIEILQHPARRGPLVVSSAGYNASNGSLESWFLDFISLTQESQEVSNCWRTQEGLTLCTGKRTDIRKVVVSIPVLLAVEFENFDGYSDNGPPWDFPDTLLPDDNDTEGLLLGLIYDLVGVVFYRQADHHFFAQYAPKHQDDIHEYDGLLRNGSPIIKLGNKFGELNSDHTLNVPPGSTVSAVFYHLRGGWKSQQRFFAARSEQCDTLYNLSFTSLTLDVLPSMTYDDPKFPTLVPTPDSERSWMNNPWSKITREYVQKPKVIRAWEAISDDDSTPPNNTVPCIESEDSAASPILPKVRPPSLLPSKPDSLFNMNCRCGISHDGNLLYNGDVYGMAIQCEECNEWLHIACQREARAGNLKNKGVFKCDRCYLVIQKLPSKKQTKVQLKRCVIRFITSINLLTWI